MKQPIPTKTDCFDHDSYMATSLPDTLLMAVASYLDPPDVYNLAQTCTRFHVSSTELSSKHFLSPPQVKPLEFLQNNEVSNLASRLLQESLIQGYTRVIQGTMSIDEARRMAKFQVEESSKGRKVLLSGSAAVQAVTGKRFEEFDLDFYANRASVSGFRKLMRDFGYCCESVSPQYEDWGETCIHHVETYIPCSSTETVAISTLNSSYYRAWNAHVAAEESDDEVPEELIDMSFLSFRNACLYNVQRDSQLRFPRDYPVALRPMNSSTGQDNTTARNKCKSGSIQLIVCRTCPTQVIAKFDMDICKCNFDGKRFHIVSPKDTFNFRTKGGDRMKFMNEYFPNFFRGEYGGCFNYSPSKTSGSNALSPVTLNHISDTEVSDEMLLHIIASVVKTAKRVGNNAQLAVLGTDNFRLLYSGSRVDYTPKYFADLHNKQVTLLQRALKYMKRGIDVPIRFDTSVLFTIGEQPPSSSDTSMMMECDDDDDDYPFSLELMMGREYESLCVQQGPYFNFIQMRDDILS